LCRIAASGAGRSLPIVLTLALQVPPPLRNLSRPCSDVRRRARRGPPPNQVIPTLPFELRDGIRRRKRTRDVHTDEETDVQKLALIWPSAGLHAHSRAVIRRTVPPLRRHPLQHPSLPRRAAPLSFFRGAPWRVQRRRPGGGDGVRGERVGVGVRAGVSSGGGAWDRDGCRGYCCVSGPPPSPNRCRTQHTSHLHPHSPTTTPQSANHTRNLEL